MKLSRSAQRQLRLLFAKADKMQALRELAEHAILNSSITLKSSKRSNGSLEIHDSGLFRLIAGWAQEQLEDTEKQIEEVEL